MAKKKTTAKKVAKKVTKKVEKKVEKKVAKKTTKKVAKKASVKKQSTAVIKAQALAPGDKAPDFTLPDQNNELVSLHDLLGNNVVVYFYPKAMTPGCTTQACEISNAQAQLKAHDIIVLGISADPVKSLKKFEEKQKLNFKLLSDVDKKVIQAYGSWGPKKFMGREFMGILRQSFLINPEGKIIHVMNKVNTKTHHQDVLDIFKNQ